MTGAGAVAGGAGGTAGSTGAQRNELIAQRNEQIAQSIRELTANAVAALLAAGARDEALARYIPARKTLIFTRKPVMVPVGRVWRLGVFLVDADATLYATGLTTRAIEPGRPAYQSQSAEVRRGYRAAAFAGRFDRGETVNFQTRVIEPDAELLRASDGPLVLQGDRLMVRWTPSVDAATTPFDQYLRERVALLAEPPEGA